MVGITTPNGMDLNIIPPPPIELVINTLARLSNQLVEAHKADEPLQNFISSAASVFAMLKSAHRLKSFKVRDQKSTAMEARQRVDRAHLGLQNLLYERAHLEREIRTCLEYQSEYQDVPLHDLDDFSALRDDPLPDDDHELMLARLKFELSERQRLEKERKDLLARKLTLGKDTEAQKAKLEELESRLTDFVASAKVIQKQMGTVI